jgi:hypothetical protein
MSEDHRRFLAEVLAALGWDTPDAADYKTEDDVLAEIGRLRREAGEEGEYRPLGNHEMIPVESAAGIVLGPGPDGRVSRLGGLLITTVPGTHTEYHQYRGGPEREVIIEQPRRTLSLMMGEDQVREAHRRLGEQVARWDGEGTR